MKKHLTIFLFTIIGIFYANAQTVDEMLAQHEVWVKQNTPDPQKLSDEQLAMLTAKTIESSCDDIELLSIIHEAGRRFAINELSNYADKRSKHFIDKNDNEGRGSLKQLFRFSCERFGEISYPSAYIHAYLLKVEEYDFVITTSEKQCSITQKLVEKERSVANEELWLNARAHKLMASTIIDDPTKFEDCLNEITDVVDFYEKNNIVSELRVNTYNKIGQWMTNNRLYYTYYESLLYKNKGIFKKRCFGDFFCDNEYAEIRDSLYVGPGLLIMASMVMQKQMLHQFHPDYLSSELTGYCLGISSKPFVDEFAIGVRIQNICDFFRKYNGRETPYTVLAHRAMMSSQLKRTEFGKEATNFDAEIEAVRQYDNGEGMLLLNYLNYKIEAGTIYGDSIYIDDINEYMDLVNTKFKDRPTERFIWKVNIVAQLQRKGVTGYQNAFDRLLSEYKSWISYHTSWEAISIGKLMSMNCMEVMGNITEVISINKRLIKLEKELAQNNHDLFACEYYDYGHLISNAFPNIPPTLDGKFDALVLLDDVAKECRNISLLPTRTYMIAANYCSALQDLKNAKQYLLKAKEFLPNDSNMIRETGIEESLYSCLLQYYAKQNDQDSIKIYVSKLEKLMSDDYAKRKQSYEAYVMLASYYATNGNTKRAEEILLTCMNGYDINGFTRYDEQYMQILNTLFQLYGLFENHVDKCRNLLENIEDDIENNKDIIHPEHYLAFLRLYYDLIESTDINNTPLLTKYIERYSNVLKTLEEKDPNNERIFYTYSLYLQNKRMNIANNYLHYRNLASLYGTLEDFEYSWNSFCEETRNTTIPELERRRYDARKYGGQISLNIVYLLALAYDKCTTDKDKAEEYYKEFYNIDPMSAAPWIMDFYLNHGMYEKAAEIAEETEGRYNEVKVSINDDNTFLSQRNNLTLRLFWSYYRSGRYEKALQPAREYYSITKKYIDKNFHLLTISERETFLGFIGAAGIPLQCLLPHYNSDKDYPSGDVYNSILHDKGLLLRSSESSIRAIYSSGNKELISNIDSLRILRDELNNMEAITEPINENSVSVRKFETLKRLERSVFRATEAFVDDVKVPTWQDVRSNLNNDEAAVEILISDSIIGALVIRHDSKIPDYVSLMDSTRIQKMLDILKDNSQEKIAELLYVKDSLHLYDMIWKPIERLLSGKERTIYYSPSGILNTISFAAIKCDDGQNLLDHYQLRQLSTTGRLAERKNLSDKNKKNKINMSVYGAICYDEDQLEDYAKAETTLEHEETRKKRGADNEFPFLDNTVNEINKIESILRNSGNDIEVKKKLEATEKEFRKLDGKSPDIIHLSTHGYYYPDIQQARKVEYMKKLGNLNAMTLSGLALSNAKSAWYGDVNISTTDNILTSAEVASLDLSNTRLAFLSACQTGLGSVTTDGVLGLQRGFKQAGVNTLCVSLWSVNDNSTANMITNFYKHLINENIGSHDAMQKAMKQQRAETPSPYDWASFVIIDAPF